ncbi:AraC family transcriptional regulator [Butyrivibrio sp. FCS014]|uniref:AraC family transcriptional regulator n=1 Tax=Butyrivibrio sp. FCS014 TaxID=1408304 RepID=UPI0004671D1F|nr:AraC family transcriptional regulator [Butyrivibrio sp. FCS014]
MEKSYELRDQAFLRHENDRITDGLDIFFWVFDDSSSYVATHWHSAIEVMYILEGEVDITVNGSTTELLPGDVFLVDSAIPHSTKSLNGNKAVLIQLPYPLLERYIPDLNSRRFELNCKSDNPIVRTKVLQLIEIIKQMQVVFEVKPEGEILRFNSLLFEFMFQIYHNFSEEVSDTDSRKETKTFGRIQNILDYLDNNYASQISLDEIASVACFQKEYFCHFFKKQMGITYTRYLNDLRLAKIRKDLAETDLPLKDILEKHGFTNYKLFRKMFNETFGCTPVAYRKKLMEV